MREDMLMGHLILKLRPHKRDLRSASEPMSRQARNRRKWRVIIAALRTTSGGNVLRSQTSHPNRQRRKLASRTRPGLSAQERVHLRDRHPSGVSELLRVQEDEQKRAQKGKVLRLDLRDHQHHPAQEQRRGERRNNQKTLRKKVKQKTSILSIQITGKGKKKVTKSKARSMSKAVKKFPNKENRKNLLKSTRRWSR